MKYEYDMKNGVHYETESREVIRVNIADILVDVALKKCKVKIENVHIVEREQYGDLVAKYEDKVVKVRNLPIAWGGSLDVNRF